MRIICSYLLLPFKQEIDRFGQTRFLFPQPENIWSCRPVRVRFLYSICLCNERENEEYEKSRRESSIELH